MILPVPKKLNRPVTKKESHGAHIDAFLFLSQFKKKCLLKLLSVTFGALSSTAGCWVLSGSQHSHSSKFFDVGRILICLSHKQDEVF